MKYLLLKLYENKKRDANLKLGINRFNTKQKIIVLSVFALMIISDVLIIPIMFANNSVLLYLDLFVMILSVIIMYSIDNKNEKHNINNNLTEYKREIDILHKILVDDFCITDRNKLEHLINLYKQDIEEQKIKSSQKNQIIVFLITALSGILSITFTNMELMSIDFNGWIHFALFVVVGFIIAIIIIYFLQILDSVSYKFKNLISDLEYIFTTNYFEDLISKK